MAHLAPSDAQVLFPGAIDHALRVQTSVQSSSNPARLSDASPSGDRSSTVTVNAIGIALRVPILSHDTRLDLSADTGVAHYSGQSALNHHPGRLNARFHWRASRLFSGQIGYRVRRERHDSDRLWPDADTVTTRVTDAELAFNPSERLAAPIVRLFDERTRYGAQANQVLFDQNRRGGEIAARYQSPTGSSVELGLQQSHTRFPLRWAATRPGLAEGFRDRELFGQIYWQYSDKTALYARAGWLQRHHTTRTERDTRLLTLDAQATWHYSPRSTLELSAWQRPYNNDEDPDTLYSTHRGAGLSAAWQATPKLTLGLQASRERQNDKMLAGDTLGSNRTRYGARLNWAMTPAIRIVVDGFHARRSGDVPWNRITQHVLRLGLQMQTDSGNPGVNALMNAPECRWTYVETDLCP